MLVRFGVLLQWVLPHHALSRLIYHATRVRQRHIKNVLIRAFIRTCEIDLDQAASPDPDAYATFNAFFTRALAAGVRTIVSDPHAAACPVDGTVSQAGSIQAGRIVQAKGSRFTVEELLGGERDRAEVFRDGTFATLYLAPQDYHRVHMPVSGTLSHMELVPGRLFSVSEATVRGLTRLFARNERVVCHFDTAYGPMALVLVGALNVGSVDTVWAGSVTPVRARSRHSWDYGGGDAPAVTLQRGAEMGRFNLGSTVIVLFANGRCQLDTALQPGAPVRMGQRLGTLTSGTPAP